MPLIDANHPGAMNIFAMKFNSQYADRENVVFAGPSKGSPLVEHYCLEEK